MPQVTQAPRRILLVDDDEIQLKLTRLRLVDAGFRVETATGAEEALAVAKLRRPDVVMSDVLMGDLDGFGLCRRMREDADLASVPVILLSSHFDGDADQQLALRVGASGLVARTPDFAAELDALHRTLATSPAAPVTEGSDPGLYEELLRTNANQLSRLAGQARSAEERYRALFESANFFIGVLDPDGVILEANERWRDVGYPPEQMVGRHIRDFATPGQETSMVDDYHTSVAQGRPVAVPIRRPDGSSIYIEFSATLIEIDGKPTVFSLGQDVTARVAATRSLAAAEERYRSLVERIPDVIWTSSEDGSMIFVTPNVERLLGYTPDEMYASDLAARTAQIHPDDNARVTEAFHELIGAAKPFDVEYRRRRKDDRWIWLRNRSIATYDRDGVRLIEGMMSDITEQKRLEESLRQAQKMEAIGQLTGGIAHDFNNILAAILSNSQFLMDELGAQDPRRADAEDINAAAERGASLTRQLLAFSRRQVLEPKVVDLNSAIGGLEKMLRRLIGEDLDFAVNRADDLGSVRVDLGQLEQVIMNLVVNARDAMPKGGKLTIDTANVELDESYAGTHLPAPAGQYVMLAVSDTGCGMDAETRRRIFEPFFTTKEKGKGTGLGLSTCYGIVEQSGGYIWVHSEPGVGTIFKVYLPRIDDQPEQGRSTTIPRELGGHETVLVVEDDDRVRNAVKRILETRGYRVLAARDGREAHDLAGRDTGSIKLILSDVIMPGSSGPQTARELQDLSPGIKVLFMSGYTDHAVFRTGNLTAGVNFIQKPFVPDALARKVREVLDV